MKKLLLPLAMLLLGFTTSPSYSHDLISCDGLENCPDGSVPLTNTLLAMQAEIDELTTLLAGVSRGTDPNTSQDTLTFTNMNVQIVSGSGTTDGETNGKGNLIIGYNEAGNPNGDNKTGSHMMVGGSYNNYNSFGGMVVGIYNETSASFASVSGGASNTASGNWASVSGGAGNEASGIYASISGGTDNTASENVSSVSGGERNTASAYSASVSGGLDKTADVNNCTTAGEIGTDCVP